MSFRVDVGFKEIYVGVDRILLNGSVWGCSKGFSGFRRGTPFPIWLARARAICLGPGIVGMHAFKPGRCRT